MAPRSAAGRFRFHAAPGAPGQAGRCHDRGNIIGGERIGLAPAPARRLAGEALQNAADAIMAGRIVGAGVDVAGADRGADGAHGGRGGALVDPLGKVGGDGERIGWQRLVCARRSAPRPAARAALTLAAVWAGIIIYNSIYRLRQGQVSSVVDHAENLPVDARLMPWHADR